MRQLASHALILAFCLGLASRASGQGAAPPEAKQLFEIVRSIQAIQDQVVLGNAGAKSRLPKVIMQLSERLLNANPEVWRDQKNARGALLYALSGGTAKVIRKVLDLGLSPAPDLELMRGTLAYLEGRHEEAKNSLSQINASALPPALGGHIAMIQSALIAKDDPREALRLLDKARVMLPGTLVKQPCAAASYLPDKFPTSKNSLTCLVNTFGVFQSLSTSRASGSNLRRPSFILASRPIQANPTRPAC
jgi:chemotaxis protein MotC